MKKQIIGVDLAYKRKWWQKLWLFLRGKNWRDDYSCVVFGHKENGLVFIDQVKHF